jgi:hypothetical protein
MKMKTSFISALMLCAFSQSIFAQTDDMMQMLEQGHSETNTKNYVKATFKGTRIINAQSVETPGKNVLQFQILHRFGNIKDGAYGFFGLDAASIRIGLDYGITERLAIGMGRSSIGKVYDGNIKYQIIKQAQNGAPLSLAWYSNVAISTFQKSTAANQIEFSNRLSFAHQLLIARKFSEGISLQLAPTIIHRNQVILPDNNQVYAMVAGGRFKISKRTSVNAEYSYVIDGVDTKKYYSGIALGMDIETGGHVFQFHVTNAAGMIEQQFIAGNLENFFDGDMRIGFNISRAFAVGKNITKKY